MSTNAAAYNPFENMALVNPIGGNVRDTTYNAEISRFIERNAALAEIRVARPGS